MRGQLKQRSKGSWTIILDAGRDPGTKREAEKRLAELVHQVDTGGYIKPANHTVGTFLEQWLRDYAATNVRPRTLEGYRDIVTGHLGPRLGTSPWPSYTVPFSNSIIRGRSVMGGGMVPADFLPVPYSIIIGSSERPSVTRLNGS